MSRLHPLALICRLDSLVQLHMDLLSLYPLPELTMVNIYNWLPHVNLFRLHILLLTVGVCDCCDGSDERNNMEESNNPATGLPYPSLASSWNVQCPNTCERGVVANHHTTKQAKDTDKKKLKSVIDNKLWLEKNTRKERYAANQEKRKQNPNSNSQRKPLYERVKTRLYVSLLVFALGLVLCLPICYCLCCVPAGFYKFRMFLLYLSQKLGLSSVKASYTLSKDAIDMV